MRGIIVTMFMLFALSVSVSAQQNPGDKMINKIEEYTALTTDQKTEIQDKVDQVLSATTGAGKGERKAEIKALKRDVYTNVLTDAQRAEVDAKRRR